VALPPPPAPVPALLRGATHARVAGQVMEQCREIYATRQKTSGDEVASHVKAKNTVKEWTAFHVALVAAKRRPTSALYHQQ